MIRRKPTKLSIRSEVAQMIAMIIIHRDVPATGDIARQSWLCRYGSTSARTRIRYMSLQCKYIRSYLLLYHDLDKVAWVLSWRCMDCKWVREHAISRCGCPANVLWAILFSLSRYPWSVVYNAIPWFFLALIPYIAFVYIHKYLKIVIHFVNNKGSSHKPTTTQSKNMYTTLLDTWRRK